MKPSSLLVSLLVLHLLLCGTNGSRLGNFYRKSITSVQSQLVDLTNKIAMEKDDQIKSKNNFNEKNLKIQDVCKDDEEDCSSKGKTRKLITSTTMPTSIAKPIQEKLGNGGKKMDMKREDKTKNLSSTSTIESSSINQNPSMILDVDYNEKEISPPEYEKAMDMTVMDYSPAKRKPPIHN
ncbi:uncharacterized protein LOC130828914 [Amaranthus tricolor]|uniref:uncharacterized protein LOC130828914 n=1 Tax=Amaranthus tricolor TaxID=29722 RepID=UPI0025844B6D|nr:uncharacterized protein LOC130828914 [Amaranthus tricolor]